MTSLRIAWTEFRRLTAARMSRIAVLALILIPSLYAGLYLYANNDPYARLDHVPAALVMADEGATGIDGEELQTGRQVADNLLDSGDFDWREVTLSEAEDGVEAGDYDFALVIPQSFSASLSSVGTSDPRQARIRLVTNDANSYLSTTIANTVVDKVRDAVAAEVSAEASRTFLLGLADVRSGLLDGAEGAGQLADGTAAARKGARQLANGAEKLADGSETLHDGTGELADGLMTMEEKVEPLPAATRKLANGARQVADADQQIADIGETITGAVADIDQQYAATRDDLADQLEQQGLTTAQQRQILKIYDRVGTKIAAADKAADGVQGQLDTLAKGAHQVAAGAGDLADAVPELVNGLGTAREGADQLNAGAGELADGAADLADGAADLRSGINDLHDGAGQLQQGLRKGAKQVPAMDADTREAIAGTIGDPVEIRSTAQTEASSYGAGLAPFFLALATWIGGYVLFLLVRPLSNRALAANQTPLRVALGGWYTPAAIGLVQVTVMIGVVAVALGIEPANMAGTWLFLVLCSACFVAIIHALNALFGSPGQFLGLVLMVLQLVTAGGTFPWQTIPSPLYLFHHLLPMSYAVDGLRQLMYGGVDARVFSDVLVLALWLIGALLVTSRVARKQRVWTAKRVKPELVL